MWPLKSRRIGSLSAEDVLDSQIRCRCFFDATFAWGTCLFISFLHLRGSENLPLKAEDILRLPVFGHRCLQSFGQNIGLVTERLDREFWDLEIYPSLSSCTCTDFGGWDMYYTYPTTIFLGKPYSLNPLAARRGPLLVRKWPGKRIMRP